MNNYAQQKTGTDASLNTFQIGNGASIVTLSDTSWTKPQTRLLIKELEKYPCLYNIDDPNFKNKSKRNEKLKFILAKLEKIKSDVTVRCIKSKIRTLQSQLYKERKNLKKYSNDTEVYIPKLWCFNEVSFLYDSIAAREPSSPIIEPSEALEMENYEDYDGSMENVENNDGSTSNEPGWKKEQTLLFLKELEKYPCLYNPTDNYFANKRKRDEQLNIMLPEVKKFKSDVTIECMVKKIRSLQVQICRETKALKQTRADEVYEPRLWCYNELSFMIQCRDSMRDWILSSNLELSEASELDDGQDDLIIDQLMLMDPGWSRKQTLLLISELQKYPCLYNSVDRCFTNKKTKNLKLNLMLPVIKKYKPDVTIRAIKQKIRTLQSQLSKEKKHKCTAEAKGEEYCPKLWCYNNLLFMIECNKLQPSSSTTELCDKSTDAPSIQLNNDESVAFKIEKPFVEQELETFSKSNVSYVELEEEHFSNTSFEIESHSNEYIEVKSFPKEDSEESNSDIQNLSKEEEFCRYLCSQFKKIQSDDNLEDLKLEILQLVSKKIKEEKRMTQQEKYFEFRPVQTTEIDPLTQSASTYPHSIKLPVSKVIVDKPSKTTSETKRHIKWPSTSSSSIYSTIHQSSTPYIISPMASSMDKIGKDLPKRTFMQISDKKFITEPTAKRKKVSSPFSLSSPNLPTKDPLALAVENIFLEEYLDYQ